MSEYGITPTGVNIKRLDTIMDELHTDLSEGWGVNTRLNPKSNLNVLITNFSDKLAELWEFGKGIYDAMYPSSAEGINLDNACQFGGTVRETAARSYYPIHCTGVDGTPLDTSTIIASATNPQKRFVLLGAAAISRSSFNRAAIKIVSLTATAAYTVSIDGTLYSFTPSKETDARAVLSGLQEALSVNEEFTVSVDEENLLLLLEAVDEAKSYAMVLTENMTTETVTSIITFASEETGDIVMPAEAIINIVQGHADFLSCTNLCPYIAGRDEETDRQLRQSYVDKIYNRSSMMLESIRSAILTNCQGVESVAPYENDSNQYDIYGRPPHSVEIVVDGGDPTEIARQILSTKAGGISTFGDEEVDLPGEYGEPITIRFNRPTYVYTWMRVGVTQSAVEDIPPNYAKLIKQAIVAQVEQLNCGEDIVPQKFLDAIYSACPGISYIDITMFTTQDSAETPDSYALRSQVISARERAVTSETMIEVALDG
mgnify:CR=1 FL=1